MFNSLNAKVAMTGFYMMATLAFNELIVFVLQLKLVISSAFQRLRQDPTNTLLQSFPS